MHIAMNAIVAAAGAEPVRPTGVPDANRVLGEVRVRTLDLDDHVTFTSHIRLVAGGRVGALDGYETLRDAVNGLARLTRGDRAGAAVLERDGRFFGHRLKGRDLEQGFRAPLQKIHFETDEWAEVVDLRADERHVRLRALVDGDWSHRFRN